MDRESQVCYEKGGRRVNFDNYTDEVNEWRRLVLQSRGIDAAQTLQYSRKIIAYGEQHNDAFLLGFGYYYSGETYFTLNDGSHFFETINRALSYLDQAEEWELMVRCYNYLGIAAMNRGNAPIALDYYLNGLNYAKEHQIEELIIYLYINMGMLYNECGRYKDAEESLRDAYACVQKHPEDEIYHICMIGIYNNLIRSLVFQNRLKEVAPILEEIYQVHWPYCEVYDKLSICCVEVLYYHRLGDVAHRDESVRMIDEILPENLVVLDLFNDFYNCCTVLLETDLDASFWHIIEMLEPLARNFNIINLQLKILSLKMQFYRKHDQSAEFLQAAGLYYELSTRMENEARGIMGNVIELRKKLESVKKARQKAEQEKMILKKKSELDALTGMANRYRLNDFSDEIFAQALQDETPLTVEILDVDYFKEFNDNYGHQRGDECLLTIANVIKKLTEEYDAFCARYGGDEFVIIIKGISHDEMVAFCSKLRERVLDCGLEHRYSKVMPMVTISQGACWGIPLRGNRMWDYLHVADDMLYKVKNFSRNNYCIGDIMESDDIVMDLSQ